MKGSFRQRSPGSWELTIDQGRDALGKRRRKHLTVRGTKAHALPGWQRQAAAFEEAMQQGG